MGSHKCISLGDLIRRTYEDKECVHFEYELEFEDEPVLLPKVVRMVFDRSKLDSRIWYVFVMFPKGMYDGGTVYDIKVKMPTVSLSQDVIKVCACGLHAFKSVISAKVQDMSVLQFAISDVISEEGLL